MDYPTVTIRIDKGVTSAEVDIVAKPDPAVLVTVHDDDPAPPLPVETGLPTWMLNAG